MSSPEAAKAGAPGDGCHHPRGQGAHGGVDRAGVRGGGWGKGGAGVGGAVQDGRGGVGCAIHGEVFAENGRNARTELRFTCHRP